MNPVKPEDEPAFHNPDPQPESLGEFAESIIDKDGELDPDELEEPTDES